MACWTMLVTQIMYTSKVSMLVCPSLQELYVRLAGELDSEGRYLLLNAMANQLRYPNAHTYYFSCTLLTLFMETKSEGLKEQITRTLLERLIVNRPHPWGLLITFIELIKNRCAPVDHQTAVPRVRCCGPAAGSHVATLASEAQRVMVPLFMPLNWYGTLNLQHPPRSRRYNFWAHSFTKCAPEIEALFTSVSRSCLGTNREQEEAAVAAAHAKDAQQVAVRA